MISPNSLKFRIIGSISIVMLILLLLMIFNNVYAIQVVRGQVFESHKNTLDIYMEQIDDALADVENFLAGMSTLEVDIRTIEKPPRDIDRYLAQYRAEQSLNKSIWGYRSVDGFFIYSKEADVYLDSAQQGVPFLEQQKLKNYVRESGLFESRSSWYTAEIDHEFYLLRTIKVWGTDVGAWLKVKNLVEPLQGKSFSGMNRLFLSLNDGTPLIPQPDFRKLPMDLGINFNNYHFTDVGNNKYMLIVQSSARGSFSLVAMIRDNSILDGLDSLQSLIITISLCVLVILLLLTWTLSKLVISPLNKLRQGMKLLRSGNFNVRLHNEKLCDEFNLVNHTFDDMTGQIQRLKINIYEEKLQKQKAELQYLQLQLNPHFFMNCLGTIHSLAGLNKPLLIQEMSVRLRNYWRYALAGNHLVPLEQEIAHVNNYLDIQRLRFQDHLSFRLHVDDAVLQIPVPPLIIQTFIENAIKHEAVPGKLLIISLDVTVAPFSEVMQISITDSGDGFGTDVLEALRKGSRIGGADERHIGIHNIRQRLALIYGPRAALAFTNEPGAGARIDIELPVYTQEREEVAL
ncbi:histidine kinase [Paenibacillus sp. MMS20-IR301]|uniref:sensor histidine kinase n=1 Tax=Paenibacillus sp. MMS20-IR301 TaxID=2895946 RepID=UPI0028EB3BBC|nr:histidine kinase [Paenibacillus sp. MMS20-IR301]WNS44114.1 histidine kinase [Paenibacillus sp. MMS20-IR301]